MGDFFEHFPDHGAWSVCAQRAIRVAVIVRLLEHRASYYQSLTTEGCRQRTGSERLQSICAWVSRVAEVVRLWSVAPAITKV
jgi:hypothetical protein